jgi:hypothetical protein
MMENDQIKTLTNQLEHGETAGLKQYFSGKFDEERIGTLNQIREQNKANRQADPNVPELQIEASSSPGSNNQSVRLAHGGFQEAMMGAPGIYSSQLDISKLTRTGGETVPENRTKVDVEALTARLERGEATGTAKLIDGLFEEERVRLFQQVQKLNEQHIADKKTNIHLYAQISASKTGSDSISIERRMPGFGDAFWGGTYLYGETLDLHTLKRTSHETNDTRK